MNEMSQWRQAIARRLASIYALNPRIAAVLVGGSTARGHANRYSDIELEHRSSNQAAWECSI
jgi:predicted nucleotidyltransferase